MHKRNYAITGRLLAVALVLILALTLTVGSASAAPDPPVAIQVAFVLDGSGSINSGEFTIMRTGLAAAVKDSNYVAQNGTIEIMVVQFGTVGGVPVYNEEVAPVIIDNQATADAVALQIEGISQIGGWTPMAGGIDLAVEKMKYEADGVTVRQNWSTASRHIINISSDGLPNTRYDGVVNENDAKAQAVSAVSSAVGEGVDEVDAEAVGVSTPGIVWMATDLVYDTTAHAAIGAPYNLPAGTVRGSIIPPESYPPRPPDPNFSGFVRVCGDWNDYADAIKEKLEHLIPQINLDPLQDSNLQRTSHEICAVITENSTLMPCETVVFEVIGGPNEGLMSGPLVTDINGKACWTYTDAKATATDNTDVITARGVGGKIDGLVATENAVKLWTPGPPPDAPGIAGWGILATVIMLSALMAGFGVRRTYA